MSDMTTASASTGSNNPNGDSLTNTELESLRRIVNHFESQVRVEASKSKYGGLSNKQKIELCRELAELMEIKRKLKLMKGKQ